MKLWAPGRVELGYMFDGWVGVEEMQGAAGEEEGTP